MSTLRPATPEDAAVVVRLMCSAMGPIAHTLAGTPDKRETLRVLESFFRERHNRVSHEHVEVHEEEGRVVGFLSAYPGERCAALDAPFIARLRTLGLDASRVVPEAREDEYYLDSLAVEPSLQGRGLGTRLLAAFEHRAERLGHTKLLLLVDEDNPKARRLYERLGYHADGSLPLSGHVYERMIKQRRG